MVSLPGLDTYSAQQLEQARKISPAFARYESLLSNINSTSLHGERHRAWMMCVLATHFSRAATSDICAFWSATADRLVARAWQECRLENTESVVFALGKQGAGELNLSSDIDVMVVAEGPDLLAVERGLRRFQRLLSASGDEGFCFRLDFDLRPGGKMGPLITTPSQFQDYYWSQGETWERLALVRLRALAGSRNLAQQIGDLARRFSFRKFLDFTLLEDLKALRSQVHQKGFDRREDELHLKLEVGGIRDIELFVHSLLVMNGGKLPTLQTPSTSHALRLLKEKNLLPATEAEFLFDSYWYFRHWENYVQSLEDRQTHSLTKGLPQAPTLAEVRARMQAVDKTVSSLLGQVNLESTRLPADENSQKTWLKDLGFSAGAIAQTWEQLINATALSYKNDRDERARKEFLFTFVTELASNKGLDRDLGLSLLVDFVRATRAKATFFSMLLRAPRLIHDLARLFCLSPYLGSIITSRPELLDNFILQVDEDWSRELEPALQQMRERKQLTELWSANQFLSDRDLPAMSARITETADSICRQLLVQLHREFPNSAIDIVALGKWAGGELGLRSDLDFIFVTPAAPNESDFKVARRFISRVNEFYDVDLRLRPSGQSGPLLVAQDKLDEYWREFAKPWERQAYLRARPLREDLALDKNLFISRGLNDEELIELQDIRAKLLRKPTADSLEIKYAPGGLVDIELAVQTRFLRGKFSATVHSTFDMLSALKESEDFERVYLRLREYEQMLHLSSARKIGAAERNSPVFAKAAGLMGLATEEAWSEILALLERSLQLIQNSNS